MLHRILRISSAALFVLAAALTQAQDRPPNIVLMFTDDQGYGDVGCYGAEGYETPNLDKLAAEGAKFTDFYVSSPVCSASRVALLTGCYHERVGISGALGPSSKNGINANEVTLAEICKQKGYATCALGKWHLGRPAKFLPTNHGFDEFFGNLYHLNAEEEPENVDYP
ncbi:MAG: sulfatase-like hydrolase/transferase, partial [Verrucomicrobiota bacterium]